MKVDVQDAGGCKRTLNIELSDEEVRAEMAAIVKEYRRKLQLPGFRKGKVPSDIVERQIGDYIESELRERLIPRAYREALDETKLVPIAEGRIRDFKYAKGEPLSFAADLEVRPEVPLGSLDGIRITKRVFEVEEGEVTHTLNALADQNATFEPVQRPAAPGDRVTALLTDLTESPGGEGRETELDLGTGELPAEFEKALTGTTVGAFEEITLETPEDVADEALRGQTRRFRVSVRQIAEKKVPPVDDNLAKDLGFEGLGEITSRIRLRLEGEEELRAQREAEDTLVQQLVERSPFDAPDVMVATFLERLTEDVKIPEEHRSAFKERQRAGAEFMVKRTLIIDAVAKSRDVTVSDEDVERAIREGTDDDRAAARAVKEARDTGAFERYRHQLRDRRVIDYLMDEVEVEEVKAKRPSPPDVAASGRE